MAWRKKSLGRKAALILHWLIAGSTAIFLILGDFICYSFAGQGIFSIGIVFGWMIALLLEEQLRSKTGKNFTGVINLFLVLLIVFLEIEFTVCAHWFSAETIITLLVSLLNFAMYYWPDISRRLKRDKSDQNK